MLDQHFKLKGTFVPYEGRLASEGEEARVMNEMQAAVFKKRDSHYLVVNAPCGSGKTYCQIWLAVHDVVQSQFTRKQLILVPQSEIGKEFVSADVVYEGRPINWFIDTNLCDEASEVVIQRLKRFLLDPIPPVFSSIPNTVTGIACVATHQAFSLLWQTLSYEEKLRAVSNLTLRIDEAHHIKNAVSASDVQGAEAFVAEQTATHLGRICQFSMEQSPSTKIHLTTATFYRGDNSCIFSKGLLEKFNIHVYSWVDFWKTTGITDVVMQYRAPEDIISEVINQILAEPHEHHLVFLPAMNRGVREKDTVQRMLDALLPVFGDRLLDLVTANQQQKNRAAMRREPGSINVILSCALFNEGTNWRPCNRIHNIDCERSAVLAVQRIGRGLRNYPNKHVLKVTYYSKPTTNDARIEYSNHTTSVAIAMHVSDLFDPIVMPLKKQVGKGSSGKTITLGDLLGSNHQIVYQELIRRLMLAETPDEGRFAVESVVAEFVPPEVDATLVTKLFMKKLVALFARRSTSVAPVDEIRKQWDQIWNENHNLWAGRLTPKLVEELKVILVTQDDITRNNIALISSVGGIQNLNIDVPRHREVREWLVPVSKKIQSTQVGV